MKTTIKATKNLFNHGQCFTKGHLYEVDGLVKTAAGLMDRQATNDLGEPHQIGTWWRNFTIIN